MENKEIRRLNMLALADKHLSLKALGELTDTPPAYLSQIKNNRDMGDEVARRIEEKLGLPLGWMDAPHGATVTSIPAFSRANTGIGPERGGRVPLISWIQAGAFAAVVDNFHPGDADEWVETTVPVRQHTYALRVYGDSMTNPAGDPTFPEGSIIVVEPDAIGSAADMVGRFVIVKRNGDGEATFKQLVKDGAGLLLKPLNPQYPMLPFKETDQICGVVREKVMRFF